MKSKPVIVIGGGIAGLAAAFNLHQRGVAYELHEAGNRWGGKIWSSPVGENLMVDAGADSFLARSEAMVDLCKAVGLADELTKPVASQPPYVFRDNNLHPYPANTFLGVPLQPDAFIPGLVSKQAIEQVKAEPTLAWDQNLANDISVGEVCRQRLGDEITNYLIDPLIGGINAASVDELSLSAATPQFATALAEHGSLVKGLAAQRNASASDKPVFYGLKRGIYSLVEAMVAQLDPANLHLNSLITQNNLILENQVICATPSYIAAELIKTASPEASQLLSQIEYSSVAQVTAEFNKADVRAMIDSPGIVFPRIEAKLITACTLFSSKWERYKQPDTVLLRCTTGKHGLDHATQMTDQELTSELLAEAGEVLEIGDQPNNIRIQRWPDSLPLYKTGHLQLVSQIRTILNTELPNWSLAGAAYDGIGIPACAKSGQFGLKT